MWHLGTMGKHMGQGSAVKLANQAEHELSRDWPVSEAGRDEQGPLSLLAERSARSSWHPSRNAGASQQAINVNVLRKRVGDLVKDLVDFGQVGDR